MSNILNVEIRPAEVALNTFGTILQQLEAGQPVAPHFSIGFETVPQFAKVFTPKRWELISGMRLMCACRCGWPPDLITMPKE